MTDAALLFSSTTNLAVTKKCVAAFAPPPSQLVWLTNAIRLNPYPDAMQSYKEGIVKERLPVLFVFGDILSERVH